MHRNDFDLRALYAALDAKRQARSLSWPKVIWEMNRQPQSTPGHPLSPSTVRGISTRIAAEGDGVLQMLLWLDRTPESFVPGAKGGRRLPKPQPHQVLRFDTHRLFEALDAQRAQRHLSWAEAAREIRVARSSLTYLAKGKRTSFPMVMRLTQWLARPAADFTRMSKW